MTADSLRLIESDKRRYLGLLLLADEQVSLIDAYLDRGDLWVMEVDGIAVVVCVVTNEGGGTFEVQNLAVDPAYQRRGYGARMLRHVIDHYRGDCRKLVVGTSDSPLTVPFYEHCGFRFAYRIPRGIADAYDHPVYENGVQLIDKVYLQLVSCTVNSP